MSEPVAFTAAMVQLRTGLKPEPALEQASAADPRGGGGRRRLRAHPRGEQHDAAEPQGAVRAARVRGRRPIAARLSRAGAGIEHPSPYRLAGAEGHAGSRGQPLVPDRRRRARCWRATTRSTCSTSIWPNGESYRESANYQPGETAVLADLPWGRIGLTICYDLRFPALYRALAEAGAIVPHRAVGLHQADRRGALAHAAARPRHRERLPSCSPRRKAGGTRTGARPSAIR